MAFLSICSSKLHASDFAIFSGNHVKDAAEEPEWSRLIRLLHQDHVSNADAVNPVGFMKWMQSHHHSAIIVEWWATIKFEIIHSNFLMLHIESHWNCYVEKSLIYFFSNLIILLSQLKAYILQRHKKCPDTLFLERCIKYIGEFGFSNFKFHPHI